MAAVYGDGDARSRPYSTPSKRSAAAAASIPPKRVRVEATALSGCSPLRGNKSKQHERTRVIKELVASFEGEPVALLKNIRSMEELERAWSFVEEVEVGCRLVYDPESETLLIVELEGTDHGKSSTALYAAFDAMLIAAALDHLVEGTGAGRYRVPHAHAAMFNAQEPDQAFARMVRVAGEEDVPTTLLEVGVSQEVGPRGTAGSLLWKARQWLDSFGVKCVIVAKVYPATQAALVFIMRSNPVRIEQVHFMGAVPAGDLQHVTGFAGPAQVPAPVDVHALAQPAALTLTREDVLGFAPAGVQAHINEAQQQLQALQAQGQLLARDDLQDYINQLMQVQQAQHANSLGPDLQLPLRPLLGVVQRMQ